MSKRTLALIIGLALITIVLVYIAVSPKPTPQTTYKAMGPTPTPAAQSHLSMNPQTVTASGQSSVNVVLNSGINKVTAVQLDITYDPKLLTGVDITAPASSSSSFFSNPMVLLKNIDTTKGEISFAVAVPPGGQPNSGTGSVATITFRPATTLAGTTSLTFTPKTLVTAQGVSTSVLRESIGATVFVQPSSSAGSSAAPTATNPTP